MIFDGTQCALGEGALWHPRRRSLFWFDIINMRMFERAPGEAEARTWQFDEHVSAAGWIDEERLLVASQSALLEMDLVSGESTFVTQLESDNPTTRSNDGRADAMGGFWIGTMGKNAQSAAGAIYRYHDGELRRIFSDLTIPNSICFSPDGSTAYFTDTPTRQIMKCALDRDGWPVGAPSVHVDLSDEGLNPDGSVVDRDGFLFNAQWGASRVARYDPEGRFVGEVTFPASQISCPAFGGDDYSVLFATSAGENLPDGEDGNAGALFFTQTAFSGQAEYQVKLG